jgi:plastocyanin domain-containing protein
MLRWISAAAAVALLAGGCAREAKQQGSSSQFTIAVTDTGFAPATLAVPADKPVTLVVTRRTDRTCAKEIVFPDQGIRKPLPLNEAVEISLPASPKREITYLCGMSMLSGKVMVQ